MNRSANLAEVVLGSDLVQLLVRDRSARAGVEHLAGLEVGRVFEHPPQEHRRISHVKEGDGRPAATAEHACVPAVRQPGVHEKVAVCGLKTC